MRQPAPGDAMDDDAGASAADHSRRIGAAIRASHPVRGLARRSPFHRLDRRRLGPGAVVAQSLGSIAPAAASCTTPVLAISLSSGSGALWSALIALVVALLVAAAINVFTRRMAAPGSLYSFAAQGLNPMGAFVTGSALLLGYAGIAVMCLVASAGYIGGVIDRDSSTGSGPGLGVVIPLVLVAAAIVAVVVKRGTSTTWALLLSVEVVSVIAVVAASIALLAAPGDHSSFGDVLTAAPPADSLGSAGLIGVFAGVIVCTSGFVGFESGAALGPEARRPFLVIPRVVRWTPIASGAVLVLATWAQVDGFTATGVDPLLTAVPMHDLLTARGLGDAWSIPLDLAVGFSFVACAIASVTALVRLLFAMGTEGVIARRFSVVHRRFRTPVAALSAGLGLVALVTVAALLLGVAPRTVAEVAVGTGVLGYMVAYVGVSIAAPRFLRRIGELSAGAVAACVTAAAVLILMVAAYVGMQLLAGNGLAVLILAGALSLAAAYFSVLRRHRPMRVQAIGVFDSTSSEDVLQSAPAAPGPSRP
jgi:amino acid transporter